MLLRGRTLNISGSCCFAELVNVFAGSRAPYDRTSTASDLTCPLRRPLCPQALFELAERGHYHTEQIVRDLIAYTDTLTVFSEVRGRCRAASAAGTVTAGGGPWHRQGLWSDWM